MHKAFLADKMTGVFLRIRNGNVTPLEAHYTYRQKTPGMRSGAFIIQFEYMLAKEHVGCPDHCISSDTRVTEGFGNDARARFVAETVV